MGRENGRPRRIWADVPEYPGYEWSNDGEIRHGKNILATRFNAVDGVPEVKVNTAGGLFVPKALMVALGHLGLPPGWEFCVQHLNGDELDCRPENLTWALGPRRLARRVPDDSYRPVRIASVAGSPWGRTKAATKCRKGHELSMTGKDDDNTLTWGTGNRVCLVCQPHMR